MGLFIIRHSPVECREISFANTTPGTRKTPIQKRNNVMVIMKQGTPDEVTLRLVLESEVHGREYFDHYDTMSELLAGLRRLLKRAAQEASKDGIERIVAVAIVPADSYGGDDDESGYGFGLEESETPT
jgi:hypothetical protein